MSQFSISRCIAIQANDAARAEVFYSSLFGQPVREPDVEYRTDNTRLFLEVGNIIGPILEMVVADLEVARAELVAKGCEVVIWGGIGKANYVRDPFGVHWNVWQD